MQRTNRVKKTTVVEWKTQTPRRFVDELVIEEPAEIRVGGEAISVTMRTPGDDFELAAGFLFTERIVKRRDDIVDVAYGRDANGRPSDNTIDVTLRTGIKLDMARLKRHFYAASSCGMCGKASICAVRVPGIRRSRDDLRVSPSVLAGLPDVLRAGQSVFDRTGGLHAAALFDASGALVVTREDVGRHNTVDKLVGHALLGGRVPLKGHVLLVSGRGGFEIVQKAAVAGVPVVASVSAPSSLAVQLARDSGMTLIGFLRGDRFIVYSGEERLAAK
jgi:FdhD protein